MPTRTKELSSRALKMKELKVWRLGRRSAMRHGGDMKTTSNFSPRWCTHSRCTHCPPRRQTPTALPVYLGYIRLINLSLYSLSPYKMDVNADCTSQALPDGTWSKLPCITTRLKNKISTHGDPTKLWNTLTAGEGDGFFPPLMPTIITMRMHVLAKVERSKMDA